MTRPRMIHETCAIRTLSIVCRVANGRPACGSPPLSIKDIKESGRIVCDEGVDAESFGARNPSLIVHCPDNDWQAPVARFLEEFRSREESMQQ